MDWYKCLASTVNTQYFTTAYLRWLTLCMSWVCKHHIIGVYSRYVRLKSRERAKRSISYVYTESIGIAFLVREVKWRFWILMLPGKDVELSVLLSVLNTYDSSMASYESKLGHATCHVHNCGRCAYEVEDWVHTRIEEPGKANIPT